MIRRQFGFSHSILLMAIIVVGLIGFTTWKISSLPTKIMTPSSTRKTKISPIASTATQPPELKEYKNTDYGFSFQYPSSWKLQEALSDGGRGKPEGDITVTSPDGTAVVFNANLGGKGGDCMDPTTNQRSARTCMTADILSLETFPSGSKARVFYLYHAKVTSAQINGSKTSYDVGVFDNEFRTPALGSYLTDVFVDVIDTNYGSVNISFTGKDDGLRSSPAFLTSAEANEASSILKTFRLLPS